MTISEMFEVFSNDSFEIVVIDEDNAVVIYTGEVSKMCESLRELVVCLWSINDNRIIVSV